MEQNLPIAAKKVWSLLRAMLFMIKKNISKRKLLLDINMMMKRGKIAGKAFQNIIFFHHHNWSTTTFNRRQPNFTFPPPQTDDYEFSCSNSPVYPLSFFTTNKKHNNHNKNSQKKPTNIINEHDHNIYDQIFVDPAVIKALEMLTSAAASPSPAVHGFGKSPMGRQLRITDSPFPLSNVEDDSHVDEAAEKFIMKFYNDLRRQN